MLLADQALGTLAAEGSLGNHLAAAQHSGTGSLVASVASHSVLAVGKASLRVVVAYQLGNHLVVGMACRLALVGSRLVVGRALACRLGELVVRRGRMVVVGNRRLVDRGRDSSVALGSRLIGLRRRRRM